MYGKLFQSMYDGTLGTKGPWEALVTFQQLVILADRFGEVDMTLEVIHRRTLIPVEILRKGIEELMKPDPDSRDPTEHGRRVVAVDEGRSWGWRIVNYAKYSQIRSAEERRGYKAQWYRDRKTKADAAPETPAATPAARPPAVRGNSEHKATGATAGAAVWEAYAPAYRIRWGVSPARNAKANSLCKQFANTMPLAEATEVIRFYLGSSRDIYVRAKHDLALALRDAQALRTEWLTGKHATDTEARQGDRTAARFNAFEPLLQAAIAREGESTDGKK